MQNRQEVNRGPRWPMFIVSGAVLTVLGLVGFQLSSFELRAQQSAEEEQQDDIRKALDSLKKGPDRVKEDKPADLNPVDALRQAQEALKKAKKELEENPQSEEARKAVEELSRKIQDDLKNRVPNFPNFPVVPFDPQNFEGLENDLQRMLDEHQKQFQMLQNRRLIIGGNRLGMFQQVGDGRLGIRIERPSAPLADQLDLPANIGVVVTSVIPETPAAKAGLKANDIILEVGGKQVPSASFELQRLLREFKADEKFDIVVLRKGKKETIKEVQLPAPKADVQNLPVPNFQIPNLRIQNGLPLEGFNGGGRTSAMSVSVTNGEFTIKMAEDGVKYTVVGTKDDGGPVVTSIDIDDNGKSFKTNTLEKVEEPYRATVEKLLKQIR